MQVQRMCTNYYVADYEVRLEHDTNCTVMFDSQKSQNPISPEILRIVASRVIESDRNDHLLLPEAEEVEPYELPLPREVNGLETYVPAYLNVSYLRRLAELVA
jgi:myosin-5